MHFVEAHVSFMYKEASRFICKLQIISVANYFDGYTYGKKKLWRTSELQKILLLNKSQHIKKSQQTRNIKKPDKKVIKD